MYVHSVCTLLLNVCVSGASCHRCTKRSRRFSKAAAQTESQPRSHKIRTNTAPTQNSSRTTAAALQALVFVPAVTVYCVGGWCIAGGRTTTTLSRSQCNNQTHTVGSHTIPGVQVYKAYSSSNSCTSLGRLCSPFSTLRRPRDVTRDVKPTIYRTEKGILYYLQY